MKIEGTAIDHFNVSAAIYECPVNERFYSDIAETLSLMIGRSITAPESIIEIGSGCGYGTAVIRRHFPLARLIALDPSFQMVELAKKVQSGAIYRNGRLNDLPQSQKVDLIIGNMCLHWFDEIDRDAVTNRMSDGGMAAFTFPLPAEASFKLRFSGNRMLYQAFKAVMDRRSMAALLRRWRGSDLMEIDLRGLEIIDRREIEIIEQLTAADFINAVASRGMALALYGPKADSAIAWLARNTSSGIQVELGWKIGMLISKKGEGRKGTPRGGVSYPEILSANTI